MSVRKARHNLSGGIDCEIKHEVFGWIPCTASPDDEETKQLYKDLFSGEYGEVRQARRQTAEQADQQRKDDRAAAVDRIKVTVGDKEFDGDEISQGRMMRALVALEGKPFGHTMQWVMADNTVADITELDLRTALDLAVSEQAAVWVRSAAVKA